MNGLTEICQKHPDQFPVTVRFLEGIDATDQDAVAIAAGALLEEATRARVPVPQELKDRFAKASPLAAALATKKPTGKHTGRQ
jgi:hypothetical protein